MALSLLERLLGRQEKSKSVAKDRLRLVLMHDRADIPPAMMEQLRTEMMQLLNRYFDIDETDLNVDLEREDNTVALVANIPIRRVRT